MWGVLAARRTATRPARNAPGRRALAGILAIVVLASLSPATVTPAGEIVAGEIVAGEVVAGEVAGGEGASGRVVGGRGVGGEIVAGEIAAGASITERGPLVGPAQVGGSATASERAERVTTPDRPTRALLISDSAWLGLRLRGAYDAVQGTDVTLALASCRRRVSPSCENSTGFIPITLLQELAEHPAGAGGGGGGGDGGGGGGAEAGHDTLIVATGYNDDDARFTDEVNEIITAARSLGHTRVIWLTLRSNVAYVSPGTAGFAEVFAVP
ncbi:MAG: hypothetical protein AAGG08_06690 [Actinomycetota bacterium]